MWNYLFKYNVFVLVLGEKVCVVWDWVQTPTYTHSRWSVREWLSEIILLDYYVFMCTPREKESSGVPRLMFVFCRSACSVVSSVCCINTTGGCCVFWLVGFLACSVHWATHTHTHARTHARTHTHTRTHTHWCFSLVTKVWWVAESSVEPVFGVVY